MTCFVLMVMVRNGYQMITEILNFSKYVGRICMTSRRPNWFKVKIVKWHNLKNSFRMMSGSGIVRNDISNSEIQHWNFSLSVFITKDGPYHFWDRKVKVTRLYKEFNWMVSARFSSCKKIFCDVLPPNSPNCLVKLGQDFMDGIMQDWPVG